MADQRPLMWCCRTWLVSRPDIALLSLCAALHPSSRGHEPFGGMLVTQVQAHFATFEVVNCRSS